jgi:hypothetical protein
LAAILGEAARKSSSFPACEISDNDGGLLLVLLLLLLCPPFASPFVDAGFAFLNDSSNGEE